MDAFPSLASSLHLSSDPLPYCPMTQAGRIKTLARAVSSSWTACLLVSEQVQGVVCGGHHLNSDHWPIDASLCLEPKELWSTVNQDEFSQRGWAPKTDEAK